MDAAFLNTILIYIKALNEAEGSLDSTKSIPYLGRCEVAVDSELIGYLVDREGGSWQLELCTEDERRAFADRVAGSQL